MIDVASIPLSLYIHFPWCVSKCPYCDFNSHEAAQPQWQRYIDALARDLEKDAPYASGRSVHSIFIGGGTPSLVPGEYIDQLLTKVRSVVAIDGDVEITLEANPGTVDAANFSEYRIAGVNRLSIGVQSFRDPQLRELGRVHNAQNAVEAYRLARTVGFTNINLDLMHSLPKDDPAGCRFDLQQAIDLDPEHISWYELTLEQGTAFARKPPPRPRHDDIVDIADEGCAVLGSAQYTRYEVSAFSKPGFKSQHNMNYWQFGDYLGIGAGAHGKLSTSNGILRTEKRRSPATYLKIDDPADGVQEKTLTPYELISEFMLNALRLAGGVNQALFAQRTGLEITAMQEQLDLAVAKGWLSLDEQRIAPTTSGYRFLNDLQMLFIDN